MCFQRSADPALRHTEVSVLEPDGRDRRDEHVLRRSHCEFNQSYNWSNGLTYGPRSRSQISRLSMTSPSSICDAISSVSTVICFLTIYPTIAVRDILYRNMDQVSVYIMNKSGC